MNAMPVSNEPLVVQYTEGGLDSGLRILARMIAAKYSRERAAHIPKEEKPINGNLFNK